jgi:hypothetical protein
MVQDFLHALVLNKTSNYTLPAKDTVVIKLPSTHQLFLFDGSVGTKIAHSTLPS